MESVCRAKQRTQAQQKPPPPNHSSAVEEGDGTTFDALCSVTVETIDGQDIITLDHHLYDEMTDQWLTQRSQPQPTIDLRVRTATADYKALGITTIPPGLLHYPR